MRVVAMRSGSQVSLLWGVAMLGLTIFEKMANGHLTLERLGEEAMIWAAAGLAFGLLLDAVLSLVSDEMLLRSGFPETGGNR